MVSIQSITVPIMVIGAFSFDATLHLINSLSTGLKSVGRDHLCSLFPSLQQDTLLRFLHQSSHLGEMYYVLKDGTCASPRTIPWVDISEPTQRDKEVRALSRTIYLVQEAHKCTSCIHVSQAVLKVSISEPTAFIKGTVVSIRNQLPVVISSTHWIKATFEFKTSFQVWLAF